MEILLLLMLVALIPAFIASHKGRNGFIWWVYGILVFIIALPHALLLKPLTPRLRYAEEDPPPCTKHCPFCAEKILLAAMVCRYCQHDLRTIPPEIRAEQEAARMDAERQRRTEEEQADNRRVGYTALLLIGLVGFVLVIVFLR